MSDLRAIVADGARAVAKSDSTADPNGPFIALQATVTAGLAQVSCAGDPGPVTIYLPLGTPIYLNVTRVWNSVTAAAGIVGFVGKPYKAGNA